MIKVLLIIKFKLNYFKGVYAGDGLLYLSKEEEKMLEGEYGYALQKAMEILVAVGDIFKAEELISIKSVHMAGNYPVMMDEGMEWLKALIEGGAKVRVFTTKNPEMFDFDLIEEMNVPKKYQEKQATMNKLLRTLGIQLFHTCHQYLVGDLPRMGDHIAWAASETQVFANSVLGARSNREGDHAVLSAAIVGKTPKWGLHIKENRTGQILVKTQELDFKKFTMTDYAALGAAVGRIVGEKIPVFAGLPKQISLEDISAVAYALPTFGAVPMFHAIGITPEAQTFEAAFMGNKPEDKITITHQDLEKVYEQFSATSRETVDLVIFGCPHCTIRELKEIASLLKGRRVNDETKTWICTSKSMKVYAERMGYVDVIQEAGGLVIADTCAASGPYPYLKEQGVKTIVTNSFKAAYYVRGLFGLETYVVPTEECINCAIEGEIG